MRDTMELAEAFKWAGIEISRWEALSLRDYGKLVIALCVVEEELFHALGALSEPWEDGEDDSVVWCSRASRIHGEALGRLRAVFPSPWPDLLEPISLESAVNTTSGIGTLLDVVGSLEAESPSRRREIFREEIHPTISTIFLAFGMESGALCGHNLRRICRGISLEAF